MSDLALEDRRNVIVVVVGRKDSGKTTLIRELYVPEHPRVITIDQTGEGLKHYPKAIRAVGLSAVLRTISDLHRASSGRAWHVVAVLDQPEFVKLVGRLAPPERNEQPSLSAALGGVCLDCSEIQVYVPLHGMTPEVQNAIAVARHHRLSWLAATQQPQNCAVLLRSQADELVAFGIHEPRALQWLQATGGIAFARIVHKLPKHWYAVYTTQTGNIVVYDQERRARQELTITSDDLAEGAAKANGGQLTRMRSKAQDLKTKLAPIADEG